MPQPNTETTNTETTTVADPDFVPHDPGGNDFDSMEIESEEGGDDDNSGAGDGSTNNDSDSADDSNDDDSDAGDGANSGEEEKDGIFIYDDKPFDPENTPTETETEKAQRLQILELQQKLSKQPSAETEPTEPLKEPGFYDAGIDGDPDKYAAAMKAYGIEAGKREAAQEAENHKQEQRRQQERAIYETNVQNYDARRAAIKATLPDIDHADVMLAQNLPQMHQAAIMCAGLENPEMVVYALYKSPELREKLTAETNPIRLGMMLADISKKSRLAPKGEKPPVNREPQVRGSQGSNPKGNGLPKEFSSAQFE
ncbi:hypothetical protein [Lelliottia wanjuensis]|uniref:hypothetical protein n=1 Tax=Lelliottia wanjuensis TaxID=3050585 RepID=UPI00254CD466|nr:hypothetical protein [Lelliottia sp. V86_10]MDK9585421.1 hypothetical protein [Lelliottia sp. V86_10]